MSRVLIPHETAWYDELNAVGYYGETELEREIRQHVRSLFPDFHVFPFKTKITSRKTNEVNKPDLAMIRHDFTAWGVIEVELGDHDIDHVLNQTRTFADGDYNAPEIAKYIKEQMHKHCGKNVGIGRIKNLIAAELPKILVVADDSPAEWQTKLHSAGVDLCLFQIFKSTRGHHIYRAFGDYPTVPARQAHCKPHAALSNTLEIVGTFQFRNLRRNKRVDVVFDENLTRWALIDDKGRSYLRFIGKENPLSANKTYTLFADRRNKYYFKIS
ncbi:MAG TPA: hypothetical protein VNZ64_09155 [Candidatus Acidoferrum sp.]|jgi:hypothetical protein|nr:hypothetical protein [Candidatus Acidoferrum sp.]